MLAVIAGGGVTHLSHEGGTVVNFSLLQGGRAHQKAGQALYRDLLSSVVGNQ